MDTRRFGRFEGHAWRRRLLSIGVVVATASGSLLLGAAPAGAVAPNGSGTMVVTPNEVGPSSTGNTLTFTYRAATGGLSGGELSLAVASGWSAPSLSGLAAGYTTFTCGTGASVSSGTILITGVTLSGGATCLITYGSKALGGPGATAPPATGLDTFDAAEKSSGAGLPTALATSPTVTVGTSTVTTLAATSVTGTTATLNGSINDEGVATAYYFAYGTSPTLVGATDTTETALGASSSTQAVAAAIGNLTPNQTYYFELITTTDGAGGILSFGTSTVTTLAATSVTGTTATLNGSINDEGVATAYYFAYGTSPTLVGATDTTETALGASSSTQAVAAAIGSLTPNQTYYFELITTTDGAGGILSFVTSTSANPLPTQIYGSDAIGTAIAISQQEFPISDSASAVVLARSDFFSDALAGGPLAAAVNGPLLITPGAPISSTIDPRVLAEIERVLPAGGTVYILGGDLALSPTIDATLQGLGYNVIREAGSDEYATAVDIAQQLGNPSTVFLATGVSFYDALSAGPAVIEDHGALLLTNGSTEAPETAAYLAQHLGDTVYAIGGPDQAAGADPSAIAVWGPSLFDTSAAVASTFFPGASVYGAATDLDFPDALAGGVFMATGGRLGPLLLVDPNSATLWPSVAAYLATLRVGTPGFVFGGPLAVPGYVLSLLQAAVG